jgi:hypothetical protein
MITMKKLAALSFLLFPLFIYGQSVAINTDASLPHTSSILDIKSTVKGVLMPRMSTLERTSIMGPAIGLTVFDTDTYSFWMYRGDVNGGWAELQHQYQNFWEGSGNNIYNKNSGNVGIGTNNPAEKLTINAADPTISFLISNAAKGFIQAGGDNMRVGTSNANANGKLFFSTIGIDRMTILPDGKVGVGTTAPTGKFQVVGGSEAALNTNGYVMLGSEAAINLVLDNNEILARNNGNTSSLYLQNSGGNVYIGDATNFSSVHRLGVDGNTVITGNLRVGTTPTPSGYRLAVDGKMICTEVLVRTVANWPDYVFSKSHRLPSLEEVEAFIKNNHHLPGIPSAKTLESTGLNVGEMQKLQMEKIEELTLYIIELKKEIEKLKADR